MAHAEGRFDGMIDLAYSVRHVVYKDPDGLERPILVASDGTEASRGSDPSYYAHPEDVPAEAHPVRLGVDYVFEH